MPTSQQKVADCLLKDPDYSFNPELTSCQLSFNLHGMDHHVIDERPYLSNIIYVSDRC